MKKVIVITGPTASGKTSLSIKLAKFINGEIINGDSVQIFKELNIGSAKIKEEEKENIKHHLFDILSIKDNYTVYNYQKDVRTLIKNIKTPIIVGGSGLYIKAALYDYTFHHLNKPKNKSSHSEKINFIKEKDPNLKIDFNNERRVTSAYNLLKSGIKRSGINNKNTPLYQIFTVYLSIERNLLKERLIKRLDQMLEKGLINEVKNLPVDNLNIIGYKEIFEYLNQKITLEEAKEKIVNSSMKYAKKQKTWFLNQMNSKVYDATDDNLFLKVKKDIMKFIEE
ncbi:MAG: tRNA (adenosine(37)-N6)-dimethylallyltransferase MiaA [Acholeplasmataceae bacterium]